MATADPTYEQREQALKEQANKGTKMIWVTFRKEGIQRGSRKKFDATRRWDLRWEVPCAL